MTAPYKNIYLVAALLWLIGAAIRIPILAIPPVLPFMRADLHMSGTEIGILSGLPMILLAVVALPGAEAVKWLGAARALVFGLFVTALGGALRGVAPNTWLLFIATVVMGGGIAVMQPALPVIVRQWFPSRIGFGTATYSNGMIAGCVLPVAATIPLIFPFIGDSWRWAVAIWSLPVLAVMAVLMLSLSRNRTPVLMRDEAAAPRPRLDYQLIWRIGLIFGSTNCIYFGTNAFLPGYLNEVGLGHLLTASLTAFNFGQWPGSLLVIALADRIEGRVWPFVANGILLLLSLAWMVTASESGIVFAAAVCGCVSGISLTMGLMLPPLLSKPVNLARTSAATFTISYTMAMIVSVAGGLVWDLTGSSRFAFLPVALSILPVILLTPTIRFHRVDQD